MHSSRVRRRTSAWLAILAMALMSLMPALTQLAQRGDSPSWVELCTAQGARLVNAAAQADDGDVPPAHLIAGHCLYCSAHAPDLGLPPVSDAVVAAVPSPVLHAKAEQLPTAASPRERWQARAPPLLA